MDGGSEVFVFESEHDVFVGQVLVLTLGDGDGGEFVGLIVAGLCKFMLVVSFEASGEVLASVVAERCLVDEEALLEQTDQFGVVGLVFEHDDGFVIRNHDLFDLFVDFLLDQLGDMLFFDVVRDFVVNEASVSLAFKEVGVDVSFQFGLIFVVRLHVLAIKSTSDDNFENSDAFFVIFHS